MRFQNVAVAGLAAVLPSAVVTTSELEARLSPLYDRLRLPAGRLELMTGIGERRFFAPGTRPSDVGLAAGRAVLDAVPDFDRSRVGMLIHASVCRDQLEPATACRVHDGLSLPATCQVYDLSNACLGVLSGMVQAATAIELGLIDAALIVSGEDGRGLVETTVDYLNGATTLTRQDLKTAVASLTIGSAGAAVLLTRFDGGRPYDDDRWFTTARLTAAACRAETAHHVLCQSTGGESTGTADSPLMHTDSERLMLEGVAVGERTFDQLRDATGWDRAAIDRTVCHQVTTTHRKLMLETLGLPEDRDFATVATLGNTGSAALPSAWAISQRDRPLPPGVVSRTALLGIGSGINCLMLAVEGGPIPAVTSVI